MRVDRKHQVFDGPFEFHHGHGFGDQFGGQRADDMDAEDLAVLCVGHHLDEAFMLVDDAGLGVGGEGELADLNRHAEFLRFGLGETDAANLRLAVGASGDAVLVDRLARFAGDAGDRHDSAHGAGMRKLRVSGHDVAHGVDGFFARLHPLVHMDVPAFGLDRRQLFEPDLFGVGPAAHGDQNFFRFQLLLRLAVGREVDDHAGFGLLDLVDFGIDEAGDALLLEIAQQLFADFFIFDRHQARQHFDDRDLGPERPVEGSKLHAHRARADDDHRFGNRAQAQHFDVGKNAVIGLQPRQHARIGAGSENQVLRLHLRFRAALAGYV